MTVPAWILVTWFLGANTPESYGYKGYPTEATCRAEMADITKDLATKPFERGKVAMACMEPHGRDPQALAVRKAAELKRESKR